MQRPRAAGHGDSSAAPRYDFVFRSEGRVAALAGSAKRLVKTCRLNKLRHCKRSEAIQSVAAEKVWIAALAMTRLLNHALSTTPSRPSSSAACTCPAVWRRENR